MNKQMRLVFGYSLLFISLSYAAQGKKRALYAPPKTDTNYIKTFRKMLTSRCYLSRKYTSAGIGGSSTYPRFRYRPNTDLNLGLGLTYGIFTLNLGFGLPFQEKNNPPKGKTRYLDLQSHIYLQRFVIDIFGQFYKGFYLSPKNYVPHIKGYYAKPDLDIDILGFSGYYIFNPTKFSYRAALVQNEWQTHSAGTFLVGANFYYGILKDSAGIIPTELNNQFPQSEINKLRFINFGPGIGYAYNFVFKKHWFAAASLTGTVTAVFTRENRPKSGQTHFAITPNFLYRFGLGYNSQKWEIVATLVNSSINVRGAYTRNPYVFQIGNYRLTFARRFSFNKMNKALQSRLGVL